MESQWPTLWLKYRTRSVSCPAVVDNMSKLRCPECGADIGRVVAAHASSATSEAKAEAARRNAKLGGWPKGQPRKPKASAARKLRGAIKAGELSRKQRNQRLIGELRARYLRLVGQRRGAIPRHHKQTNASLDKAISHVKGELKEWVTAMEREQFGEFGWEPRPPPRTSLELQGGGFETNRRRH